MRNHHRLTRQQRRELRTEAGQAVTVHPTLDDAMARHPSNQARAASVPPSGRPGLVKRARAVLARRMVDKLGPAVVPPLVAGAVVLVTVGLVVGLCLGIAMAALARREMDL